MNPSSGPNTRELLEFERQTAKNARTALNNFLKQSPKPWCRVEYYEKNERSGHFFEGEVKKQSLNSVAYIIKIVSI